MRILFLVHAFNSLSQRLHAELSRRGHELSVEYDVNDAVTLEAVQLFEPELILAPFLKRAIPEAVWRRYPCLVVHPGIEGDRGPCALDWAVQQGETEWGVTVLQADAVMDAGPVWATEAFPLRPARKASLYRHEVTEAATRAVLRALERHAAGAAPRPLDYNRPGVRGRLRPAMRQSDRRIDWARDDTATVLRRIRAADGFPGMRDRLAGIDCRLFDAHPEPVLRGAPGELLARREGAVCRATVDGAVWLGHLRADGGLKLPAMQVLGEHAAALPESLLDPFAPRDGFRDIRYHEAAGVGYLAFEFYNGAMGTEQCRRLTEAYRRARARDTRVLVLLGGADFWSNGIHLNRIEAAESPADESWRNIQAMNDLVREILVTDDRPTVAALRGNAGAGGVFLALAADRVLARDGVVLNPHYKNMGNLYGSEYWTYTLPRRVGAEGVAAVMGRRLPVLAADAAAIGLVDAVGPGEVVAFEDWVRQQAEALAADPDRSWQVAAKRARRQRDEAERPLEDYREEELARMRLNFYGFDPSYHVARYNFVHRRPHSWTPLHLARHRRRVA